MSDTVIKVENLGKLYKLGEITTGTISHDLKRWWASVRGKEDPFAKVGMVNDRTAKGTDDYVWALKDVNFEVKRGEALGIIGRNGAGKSTLLKLLSKVTSPTTGSIKVKGRLASLLEVGTGFHPELTGRENIFLNGAILGMTKAEIKSKFDEILDFAGVEKYIDTPVKRYSSGMYVRLAFAVAAHLEPEVLIVDEVLAVGDAEFQKKCLGKMKDVSEHDGRTVLFVSHNMTAVKSLCGSGILMKNGTISYNGTIDNVIDQYIGEQDLRSQISISEITNRLGNGVMRFTDIDFIDSKGVSRDTFEVGEEMTIKVSHKSTIDFEKADTSRIDIGINDILGTRIAWLSTYMFVDKIRTEDNSISFKIPQLLLNQGTYNINLHGQANSELADWVTNVAKFNIVFHDFYKTGRAIPEKQGYIVTNFELI